MATQDDAPATTPTPSDAELEKLRAESEERLRSDPNNPELLHQASLLCVQRGDFDQAIAHIRRALQIVPGHPALLINLRRIELRQQHREATVAAPPEPVQPKQTTTASPMHQGAATTGGGQDPHHATPPDDEGQYIQRIRQVLALHPDHFDALLVLGALLAKRGDLGGALEQFQKARALQADRVDLLCQIGQVFVQQGRTVEAIGELSRAISLDPRCAPAHSLLAVAFRSVVNHGTVYPWGTRHLSNYHQRMASYHSNTPYDPHALPSTDTFFADREKARSVVLQGTPHVCYHAGEPFADAPAQLVCIPADPMEAGQFFYSANRRLPEDIDFDPGVAEQCAAAERLLVALENLHKARARDVYRLAAVCEATRPEFIPGQPLRVFVPATQHRPGFWTLARDYARGFAKAGCQVLFFHESKRPGSEEWEVLGFSRWQREQIRFNPHVIFDINANFDWHAGGMLRTHPDTFKALWFQDPIPSIVSGQPIPWRKRDLIYYTTYLDRHLYQTGATKIRRDAFCYDEEIFRELGVPRKRKAVLVGGGYSNMLGVFANSQQEIRFLEGMFCAGEPLTEEVLEQLCRRFSRKRSDFLHGLWTYVVRNVSARWLCELSREMDIEVDIYGYSWEGNEAVQPFLRGRLPFASDALVQVYNEALYVLSPQPDFLHTARLVETAACGAIPISYDCRYMAAKPHYDNNHLWYRTKEDMRAALTQHPPESPRHICQGRTFTDFAKRVVADLYAELAGI
ncbi:MAG: tetratricopeptide repeat protein [Magnetococcales bacterium]|nr:tetratricopeptide repeat protein [Magnetococcales bacterium]